MAAGTRCGISSADFSDEESASSDRFIRCCNLKTPATSSSVIPPVNSSQLCEKLLKNYIIGGVSYEKENISDGQHWFDYSPDTVLINNTKIRQRYTDNINHNIHFVSNFCVEDITDTRLKTAMNDCFQRARFQNLLEYYPIEFGKDNIKSSFNNALQIMKEEMTADVGQDIQRNVSFLYQGVMLQLVQSKLINGHYFHDWCRQHPTPASDLLNEAVGHTTAMIRCFVKLFCIDKAEDGFLSKDDRHQVWKSVITELARYAGVMYSLDGESKRYFISRGNQRVVTVKADLEIMMNACLPFFEAASVPRIIVQVYRKKGQPGDSHNDMEQGNNVRQRACPDVEVKASSPSTAGQKDSGCPLVDGEQYSSPSTAGQKDSGCTHGNTQYSSPSTAGQKDSGCLLVDGDTQYSSPSTAGQKDSGCTLGDTQYSSEPVPAKIATKRTDPRNASRHTCTCSDSSSGSSDRSNRGQRHTSLPDCIKENKNMSEIAWVKKKLFVEHAAQLMTVQQSLEYCNPRLPDQNNGQPVIGLFMHDEKVFFTKLTGSEETGRKFTVSNWCLHMDRFADRLLLMVFLCAYCKEDINLNVSAPVDLQP